MKKYKNIKRIAVALMVLTTLSLVVTVLFYNLYSLEFVSNLIEQIGKSFVGKDFTITSDVSAATQRWSLVVTTCLTVFELIFIAASYYQAEKIIKRIKTNQKVVVKSYTGSKKDQIKLQEAQIRELKMKAKEEKKSARLAKKEAKLQKKEEKLAAKLKSKEEKTAKVVKKAEAVEAPKTVAEATRTVQDAAVKTQKAVTAGQKRINDILNSLK